MLIVVDLLTGDGHRYAALIDLYMLSLFGASGGRERNATEFTRLIERAGFRDVRVTRLPSGMGCVEARAR